MIVAQHDTCRILSFAVNMPNSFDFDFSPIFLYKSMTAVEAVYTFFDIWDKPILFFFTFISIVISVSH